MKEAAAWFEFYLQDGFRSIGRVQYYWDKEQELRLLICIPNSGTILDYPFKEVIIGNVLEAEQYYSTRFLSFILLVNGDICPNRTISQKKVQGGLAL